MRSIIDRIQPLGGAVLVILSCSVLQIASCATYDDGRTFEPDCPHTICVGVPNRSYINNPLNCAAYFQCVDGRAIPKECTNDRWFNFEIQDCDIPWNVACNADESIVIDLECVSEAPPYRISCRGRNDLHIVPHPSNCSQYYLCIGGDAVLRSCAPGLELNREMQVCMTKEEAQCTFDDCPPYNYPLTFLPSAMSCGDFSICFDGEPQPQNCADGLHWDQENAWCTWPDEANCKLEGSGEGSGEIELVCHPDSPMFNPDPNDCQRYFLCDEDLIPHPKICADGLYFDVDTTQCRPPDQARCHGIDDI